MPSALRAIRMPEPPDPVIHNPERMQVNMARATAFCITLEGMIFGTRKGDIGVSSGAPVSSSFARKPSAAFRHRRVSKSRSVAGYEEIFLR